jgi:hypothetical protein
MVCFPDPSNWGTSSFFSDQYEKARLGTQQREEQLSSLALEYAKLTQAYEDLQEKQGCFFENGSNSRFSKICAE